MNPLSIYAKKWKSIIIIMGHFRLLIQIESQCNMVDFSWDVTYYSVLLPFSYAQFHMQLWNAEDSNLHAHFWEKLRPALIFFFFFFFGFFKQQHTK